MPAQYRGGYQISNLRSFIATGLDGMQGIQPKISSRTMFMSGGCWS